MLSNAKLYTVLSSTDINRAREFYGQTLGLTEAKEDAPEEEGAMFKTDGGDMVYIYQRSASPKAENTIACFRVPDLGTEMEELRSKGVTFEEYDFPGIKTENGVATHGKLKSAWFKDPDGNIISVTQVG